MLATGLRDDDIQRMRDQLFFEGPARGRRLSRYWLLLVLSAIIASAGVVSDSTATVIGAMIVAPLMTPILGIVLAVVLTDRRNLVRCLALVLAGSVAVIGLACLLGLFVPYPVLAASNSQVAGRITPRLVDLLAAFATGAVGSVALARSDISDTLPGVAIAISLVPPLAVVGLTLESGAPHEALGALLLFGTNVVAILVSGIIVMAFYRVLQFAAGPGRRAPDRAAAILVITLLLVAVVIPLWINSEGVDRTNSRVAGVTAVAEHWASDAGWSVVGVTSADDRVYVEATGPTPGPDLASLRKDLDQAGLDGFEVLVNLKPDPFTPLPG
jgi:uncharacterized hydrophobic protein (TIGR00271 family)